jgi:hypothetical protein
VNEFSLPLDVAWQTDIDRDDRIHAISPRESVLLILYMPLMSAREDGTATDESGNSVDQGLWSEVLDGCLTGAPCLHRQGRGTTWVEQAGAKPLPMTTPTGQPRLVTFWDPFNGWQIRVSNLQDLFRFLITLA